MLYRIPPSTTTEEQYSPRGHAILLSNKIYDKILFDCTLCKACEEKCPLNLKICTAIRKARQVLNLKDKGHPQNQEMLKKLEEKKNVDGVDMVHLRQIFVKTQTFADWLKEQMKGYSVVVFLSEYQWNKDQAVVEFKDPGMRQFEANIAANSEGDPSIFP